jgi:outer membrane murein-binding lipoprotein Lpp
MAVPRPILLLAVLGAVLLAATFYTVQGARSEAESQKIAKAIDTAQPQPAKPVPKHKATAKQKAAAKHNAASKPDTHRTAPAKPKPAKPDKPAKPRPAPRKSVGIPADVVKAIDAKKTVVVLFYRRGLADDDATARAVSAARSKRVAVFLAAPKRFGAYRRLVGGLDLSGLPATVIVGRDRAARVITGFVDSRTLAQEVADSAR